MRWSIRDRIILISYAGCEIGKHEAPEEKSVEIINRIVFKDDDTVRH